MIIFALVRYYELMHISAPVLQVIIKRGMQNMQGQNWEHLLYSNDNDLSTWFCDCLWSGVWGSQTWCKESLSPTMSPLCVFFLVMWEEMN